MALYHYWQSLVAVVFGGFSWILSRFIINQLHNMYVTKFPQWAGMPHVSFMYAIANWGFLIWLLGIAIYLWTQTQRPEVMQG